MSCSRGTVATSSITRSAIVVACSSARQASSARHIARAIPHGWRLHFKGGWGSGTGAVDHQVGLLRHGRHRVAIAVLTVGNPSHAYGTATLEGMGRRLLHGLAVHVTGTAGPAEGALQQGAL